MRVLLLNDGGYHAMEDVTFPVEVKCDRSTDSNIVYVHIDELKRVGYSSSYTDSYTLCWQIGIECEVIE